MVFADPKVPLSDKERLIRAFGAAIEYRGGTEAAALAFLAEKIRANPP